MNPVTLLAALQFAAEKHRHQRRKGSDALPYINHPIAVASVLAEAGVTDEATILAAILHDTVEDTDTTFDELERAFGHEVRVLVGEVTDDKSLPKQERKRLQIERAPNASDEAKRLKIADKICNVRDITANPPADWTAERRKEYLDWAQAVVKQCRGAAPELAAIFDHAIEQGRSTS